MDETNGVAQHQVNKYIDRLCEWVGFGVYLYLIFLNEGIAKKLLFSMLITNHRLHSIQS